MAGTIDISIRYRVRNGNFDTGARAHTSQVVQNGIGLAGGIVSVGTTEEAISAGDLSTEGLLYLFNCDDENYVEYGPESSGAMVTLGRLNPGEAAWLRTAPGVTLRAKANTAAVALEYAWYED